MVTVIPCVDNTRAHIPSTWNLLTYTTHQTLTGIIVESTEFLKQKTLQNIQTMYSTAEDAE